VSIDFSGLNAGDIVTNQFSGVSISLLGSPPMAGPRIYVLEDTVGNPVDVLGATGNAITPGDNVGGVNPPFYDMQFSFSNPTDFFQIQILDAEESVTGNAYLGSNLVQLVHQGTPLGFHSGSVFNGPVYQMTLGSVGGPALFDRVVIDLTENDGPELFDNVSFNPQAVPEPSTALLTIAALLAGLSVTRFRKASQ
jgi:hypothetical protein